jgi:hypothetical protein
MVKCSIRDKGIVRYTRTLVGRVLYCISLLYVAVCAQHADRPVTASLCFCEARCMPGHKGRRTQGQADTRAGGHKGRRTQGQADTRAGGPHGPARSYRNTDAGQLSAGSWELRMSSMCVVAVKTVKDPAVVSAKEPSLSSSSAQHRAWGPNDDEAPGKREARSVPMVPFHSHSETQIPGCRQRAML